MSNTTLKITSFIIILAFALNALIILDYYGQLGNNPSIYEAKATILPNVKILAPYGESAWGPYRDGVIVVGDQDFAVRISIYYPEEATETITNIKVWADTTGVPEEGYNVTFITSPGQYATAVRYDPKGKVLEELNATVQGRYILLQLPSIAPGEKWEITYVVNVPSEKSVPKLPYEITLETLIQFGENVAPQTYPKTMRIIDRPISRLILVWILALGTFAGVIILGNLGFFRFYSSMDLVSMAMIGAIMVVWVQILGRQLIFPAVNRIPMTHNFAVADFPYILLLVTSVALVRKPGVASLTLFVYNIVSEIGWYGLNILWWAYPFAQGLPVDFYLLIRGKGVLTERSTFFRFRITEEELEEAPVVPFLKYLDGFMIGLLRGFFMQISLYTVFYPNLFRIEFFWEYVLWWHVIPWTIGNAISGALSVPIVEKIEEAITY